LGRLRYYIFIFHQLADALDHPRDRAGVMTIVVIENAQRHINEDKMTA